MKTFTNSLLLFLIAFILFSACNKEHQVEELSESIGLLDTLLLKDYRPQAVYNIPKTSVLKPKYFAIDVHTHDYTKDEVEIAKWVKDLNEKGIRKAIVLTAATGSKFDSIYTLYSKYPNKFEIWCGFDYTGYDEPGFGAAAVAELERCVKVGATGVGELGDKGWGLFYSTPTEAINMHLDDPRMDMLLEKCAELNLPINIHIADAISIYEPLDAFTDGLPEASSCALPYEGKGKMLTHNELHPLDQTR